MVIARDFSDGPLSTASGPNLSTLWSNWNTALGNANASGHGSLKFTPAAADDAIRSCNTLLGYLGEAASQLSSLTIDAASVMRAPLTVPNLSELISQYNTMAQENLSQVLSAHQAIVTDMRDTFRVASGLIQKTDLTSASSLAQVQAAAGLSASSSSGADPTLSETVGNQVPALLTLPTGNAKMSVFDNPVTEFQQKDPYDDGLVYLPADDGPMSYTGQLTSHPKTAGVASAMDWPELVALGKVNPQPISNAGRAWIQLAGYLSGGFRGYGTDMSAAISTGSWTGQGHQAAENAVKTYQSSFPDLVAAIHYMGTLMAYTANWLDTTTQFMPTLESEPWSGQYLGQQVSAGAGPAVTYSYTTQGTGVSFDGAAAYFPGQTISFSFDPPPAAKPETITALYQGGWVQANPATVQSTLMNYYQQQYENWYEGPYTMSSVNVPALSVPKSPVSPTVPSTGLTGSGGSSGSGVGSVPIGVSGISVGTTTPKLSPVGTVATTATNTPGATVSTGGGAASVPVGDTAATAASALPNTATSDLSSVASGLAGTGQQAAQALSSLPMAAQAAQALGGVPGLPGLGRPDQAARALTGLKAGGSVGAGGGGVASGGAGVGAAGEAGALADTEATAGSRLFPRASLAGAAEDPMVGRAGAAEPSGSPGAPGSAGRGSGEQDKQRKRAEYLRSHRHVEDAMGDALLTTAPVVDS
jgi:hypothetical protein